MGSWLSGRLASTLLGFVLGVVLIVLAAAAGWLDAILSKSESKSWGQFVGKPDGRLLEDGRTVQLLADFAYLDPHQELWSAKRGSVVDGASIPRAFWTVTGGPLDGKYRNASIVHDVYCVSRTNPSDDVHNMFYEACRCGGVPEAQAKTLFAAVYFFGPKWVVKSVEAKETKRDADGNEVVVTKQVWQSETIGAAPTAPDPAKVEKLKKLIADRNPSIEEIKKLKIDQL